MRGTRQLVLWLKIMIATSLTGFALSACNSGGEGIARPTGGFDLSPRGGTCNVTIYCNGRRADARLQRTTEDIVTGELARHIQLFCAEGYDCPYEAGELYSGGLCDGKERDEAVDITDVPCKPRAKFSP